MRFVDSHAHLADPAFDADRDAAIARARAAGAAAIVAIGESLAAAGRARLLAAAHPGFVYFTAGVHPHDAESFDPLHDPGAIRAEVDLGAVAIGECGLDYHYDHAPRALQRRAFASQLALAAETGRPVVVHTRDAEDDTAAMVREAGAAGVRGVLHCFTGSHALAHAALEAEWYISFSGIVTFRKWERRTPAASRAGRPAAGGIRLALPRSRSPPGKAQRTGMGHRHGGAHRDRPRRPGGGRRGTRRLERHSALRPSPGLTGDIP